MNDGRWWAVSRRVRQTQRRLGTVLWMLGVTLATMLPTNSLATQPDSTELREQLFSSAPAAWQKIEELASHVETIVMDRRYDYPDGRLGTEIEWHNKLSGAKCIQLRKSLVKSNVRERVLGHNDRYTFEIGKSGVKGGKSPEQTPWQVRFVGQEPSSGIETKLMDARNAARAPIFLGPSALPTLWDSPSFKVLDVKPASADGAPVDENATLVEVAFENAKRASADERAWPTHGKFTLEPGRLWAVKSYDIQVAYDNAQQSLVQWQATLDFQPSAEGLPLMRKRELIQSIAEVKTSKTVWDYEKYAPGEFPDQDFTLTAFGLPEIQGPSLWASSRLWLYLLAAGVVCVVIGIALRKRSGRAAVVQ